MPKSSKYVINDTNNDSENQSTLQSTSGWFSSQDTQQQIALVSGLLGELFKITMSCLLSVFVPQSCNGSTCSIDQNFSDLSAFNLFVIIYNFMTLGFFIILYIIEVHRETWLIQHLEKDPGISESNLFDGENFQSESGGLVSFKVAYPKLHAELESLNTRYLNIYNIITFFYITNSVFSGVLVFYYYYLDYRTVTGFFTNIMLCSSKIRSGRGVATQAFTDKLIPNGQQTKKVRNIAISYYNTQFVAFNIVDPDYSNAIRKNEKVSMKMSKISPAIKY